MGKDSASRWTTLIGKAGPDVSLWDVAAPLADRILKWRPLMDGGKKSATMTCQHGHVASLVDHTIDANGVVSPSVVCPDDGCPFHTHVKLDGWQP